MSRTEADVAEAQTANYEPVASHIVQRQGERRWRSVKEATVYSGLSRTFLLQRIGSGDVLARKAGRRTLIDWPQFEAWLVSLPRVSSSGVKRPPLDQLEPGFAA